MFDLYNGHLNNDKDVYTFTDVAGCIKVDYSKYESWILWIVMVMVYLKKLITRPLTKIIVFVWPNQAGKDEAPMTGSFVITQTELRCVA